ncbi:MAG: bifunctional folylpolyglutamate synthase/dihydrofolate synthase, partial [Oscillospiraceae bacterium]|nr:bifunctional folylpolyglutamate synthase/dihydrofolate synthase [Oscillospiraceae bacterium]
GYAITDEHIAAGLKTVAWQGRFEVLRRNPTVILDGAHNSHGIAAACESFTRLFGAQKLVFLVGVMADKDVTAMFRQLTPFARVFVTTTPPNPRAMPAAQLAELLRGLGAEAIACDTIEEAAHEAVNLAGSDGVVVALGSLYFSADVRRAISG